MGSVAVSGANLYFETRGRGDPMLMIRGWGSNADHWYAQVPAFESAHRVITFDNRGIARSIESGGAITIPVMAADTVALMDALGLPKVHLLGVSMGGMIAQEVALAHPKRIITLILVATHCGGTGRVAAHPAIEGLMAEMAHGAGAVASRAVVDAMFAGETLEKHPEIIEAFDAVSARYPASPSILRKQWQAIGRHDTFRRLHRIQAPALVLTGDQDRIIPFENSSLLAAGIPGARCRMMNGGGHQVLIERPEACNAAVLDFVRRCSG